MVTGWRLMIRYSAFAVLATLANLGAQRLVLAQGESGAHFAGAVLLGTVLGLIVKYALDKRWIFGDAETGLRAHSRKFSMYSAMGLVTTAIFWAMETGFWMAFGTHTARELGALLGLGIGYLVKYQLDKRFVFAAPQAQGV